MLIMSLSLSLSLLYGPTRDSACTRLATISLSTIIDANKNNGCKNKTIILIAFEAIRHTSKAHLSIRKNVLF